MLESMINAGKPLICWPFFAEQQTNTRYACTTWGIGMEVNHDVKRDEIEGLVKEVMEGEKGKKMKEKALEWQKKAIAAANIGGTSYNNLDRCIREVFSYALLGGGLGLSLDVLKASWTSACFELIWCVLWWTGAVGDSDRVVLRQLG
ncbi:hypothetical protein JRO89_XSUnG0255000 [Xanthoceras sorbifolium]|uniref:Uncharacterized protein n=1 Tax=Xanthoceras sorbifolium TaxID=99658 RepID=A0ABQ8GWM6_9ROSI|nr:hypothetical protein JRO89_XSUnG0255000 [Xanthoceras sorbifolium]